MVPELARMAVIIKAGHKTSVMTGNYELGYACGLMGKASHAGELKWEEPKELLMKTMAALEGYAPADEHEENVIHMLKFYHPDQTADGQIRQLYEWGLTEEHPWQMLVKEDSL